MSMLAPSAAFRGGDPAFQVVRGVGGCHGAVRVAKLFFELPGAPEAAVPTAELVDDRVAGVVEVLGGEPVHGDRGGGVG
jgi:hypothetical protein